MIGSEFTFRPGASFFEKLYIQLLGVPICGLRIRMRRILPHLTGSPRRILDAGCGRGIFTYELAKRYPDAAVMGVDMDVNQLSVNREIAKKAGLANCTFSAMDVSRLPFKEDYDLILSVDNLEHIEDGQAALAGLAAALRPGGRLILHVPAYERRWFFRRFRTNFDVPGHFRPGYRLEEITALMRASGLKVNEAYYTYGFLENLANNISYAITKAEAKNKILYGLAFPLLNLLSWFGRKSRPVKGAGVLVIAGK